MTNVGYHIRNGWLQKPPLGVQLNWAHQLTKGPVACLLFNEGSGDKVYDLSGYNNHGTLKNFTFPPTTASGWNPGKDGVGLVFDGSSNYIDCGNDPSLKTTDAITIKARLNYKGPKADVQQIVVGRGANWRFGYIVPDSDSFRFYAPAPYTGGYTPNVVIPRDTWHDVVLTYDESLPSNNTKLYVDGILECQEDASGSLNTTSPVYIGAMSSTDYHFNGFTDNVYIYNRALNAEEIQQLHVAPYAMFDPATKYTIVDARLETDYVGGNVMAAELI